MADKTHELADVRELLNQRGQRMTEQRRLVLEAIRAAGEPICAPHILNWIQQRNPQVNKSTVYRTVEALQQLGVICAADLGAGRIQYEIYQPDQSHHHLVCEQCGASIEIDDTPFQALRSYLHATYGFEPRLSHTAIHGVCAACARQN